MKKFKKISIILIGVILLFTTLYCSKVSADYGSITAGLITKVTSKGDTTSATSKISGAVATIITIVRIVGVCVAIAMLLTVAMKYMTAAAGEKAEIKKSAVQYVVGAIVLFGAVGILGIIGDFSENISYNG